MKRALKIVSRKRNKVAVAPARANHEFVSKTAVCEQENAHTDDNRTMLNTINELVLTISHHLNNPLTVLLGKVELLSQINENGGLSGEDIRRFVEACKREIIRIEATVKAFQDLCQVQHKTYPPGVRMLDVEKEIEIQLRETSFLR